MPSLVVETGSMVPGANSYIALSDAQTYWTTWGYASVVGDYTANATAQSNALYAAAYAMERLYGRLYIGDVMKDTPQAMLWPRQGVYGRHMRAPQVQVLDSTGAGAKFAVWVVDGVITNIYIVNGGAGYTAPTLQINDVFGTGATATATITSGVITSITITNGGTNYTTPNELPANDGRRIQNNQIPQALKDAQCELAVMYIQGTNIFPNESDARVIQREVDKFGQNIQFETQYFEIESTDIERYDGFRKVELILWPVLNQRTVFI